MARKLPSTPVSYWKKDSFLSPIIKAFIYSSSFLIFSLVLSIWLSTWVLTVLSTVSLTLISIFHWARRFLDSFYQSLSSLVSFYFFKGLIISSMISSSRISCSISLEIYPMAAMIVITYLTSSRFFSL
jgi:hypothetical protein